MHKRNITRRARTCYRCLAFKQIWLVSRTSLKRQRDRLTVRTFCKWSRVLGKWASIRRLRILIEFLNKNGAVSMSRIYIDRIFNLRKGSCWIWATVQRGKWSPVKRWVSDLKMRGIKTDINDSSWTQVINKCKIQYFRTKLMKINYNYLCHKWWHTIYNNWKLKAKMKVTENLENVLSATI